MEHLYSDACGCYECAGSRAQADLDYVRRKQTGMIQLTDTRRRVDELKKLHEMGMLTDWELQTLADGYLEEV